MGLVVIDTDVLALHHVFTWDKRYNINREFLKMVEEPATTIHNLLELVSIIFRARRGEDARRIYRSYMLSQKWTILYPEPPVDWEEYCDKIFAYLEKGMSYGDSLIAWTLDENADQIDSFVTWNKKDFENRIKVPVLTPQEWINIVR